ncbi:hypothetical protein D3C87_1685080 [compost metagenome]
MGNKAIGKPSRGPSNKVSISLELVVNKYFINLRMLSYTFRPSRTAVTIVEKLSSSRIISAASFATSVPVIPMAIPMFAAFNDGASFNPSPVIAT